MATTKLIAAEPSDSVREFHRTRAGPGKINNSTNNLESNLLVEMGERSDKCD